MARLGIGVIGFGWMGRRHTEAYLRLPHHFGAGSGARLVVAAEVSESGRAEALELGYERVTESWREVVDDPEVDAVSITAPNWLHREAAVAAAERGKHIWIEKPAGRGLEETMAIADAVSAARVLSLVGFDLRFAPTICRARELLREGRLGEVRGVRASFLTGYASDPQEPHSWRFSREQAGSGALGDLMIHLVDLLAYLVGPIAEVSASTRTLIAERPTTDGSGPAAVENEDSVVAMVRFEAGAEGVVEASRVASGHRSGIELEVVGATGSFGWRFDRLNELELSLGGLDSGDSGRTRVLADPSYGNFAAFQPAAGLPMGYDDLKVVEAHQLCRAISGGGPVRPSLPDALAAAEVIAAMERSSGSGGGWERVLAG